MAVARKKKTGGRVKPGVMPRVLLVSTPEVERRLRAALTAQGWPLQAASSGRAALTALQNEPADVVLVLEQGSPRATVSLVGRLAKAAPAAARVLLARGDDTSALLSYVNRGVQAVVPAPLSGRRVVQVARQAWQVREAERVAIVEQGDGYREILAELQARMDERERELTRSNRKLRRAVKEIEDKNRALVVLNESLRVQSTTDPLTGLYNRREFLNRVRTEWGRYKRYGRPLSLIMLDIDHFKQINDTYGHECGDVVLRGLGQLISQNKRAQDLCCRYGGEEFILLLTETTLDAAFKVAEGLRILIRTYAFKYEGRRLTVHVSLGVCGAVEQHPTDVEQFINMADKAMYRAKREGRDRTVVLDAEDESRILHQTTDDEEVAAR